MQLVHDPYVYALCDYGFDVTCSRAKRQAIQRMERALALREDRSRWPHFCC
jgi:hypothetical protein